MVVDESERMQLSNGEPESSNEREQIIRRVVEEKGAEAFESLVKLLEDEDEEVKELVADIICRLGDAVSGKLERLVKDKIRSGERNSIPLLYLIDIAGELGLRNLVPDLRSALSLYDLEESQLVIYEALAKLGAGEEFYPLLRYMLLEGEERFFLGAQVAMAMSFLDIPEVVGDLVHAIDSGDFQGEELEIIKKSLSNIVGRRPAYKEILITLVGEESFEKYLT